jgi:hypothetical protein
MADLIVHRRRRTAVRVIAAGPAGQIAFGVACRGPLDGHDVDVEVDDDGLLPEHLSEAWSSFGYASALYAGPGTRVDRRRSRRRVRQSPTDTDTERWRTLP